MNNQSGWLNIAKIISIALIIGGCFASISNLLNDRSITISLAITLSGIIALSGIMINKKMN